MAYIVPEGRDMRLAVVMPAAGAPSTLATTAFIGSLAEGISAIGVPTRVVGLTLDSAEWIPETLGECEHSAPWLAPIHYRLGDRVEAARRGIFGLDCSRSDREIRWRLELLLERDLEEFSTTGADNVLLVDSRSHFILSLCCRVAYRLAWKVIVVSNEALLDHLIDPETRDVYVRTVVSRTAGVWAFSDHLASYWADLGMPRERIFVSPPTVRASSFAAWPHAPWSAHATYIGNLAHQEIGNLLEVAEKVAACVPGFRLTIYGDAPERARAELELSLASRGLSDVVEIREPVAPLEVPRVLALADVLLLPRSSGEFSTAGFPNKLGEYLASGRPVVVSSVGDIPKYLVDGESAFLVEPDDNEAFAETVMRVVRDPASAEAVGTQGRLFAESQLRADIIARRLVDFLEEAPEAYCDDTTKKRNTPLWQRLNVLRPDPDLTRRDISLLLRGIQRRRH